MAKIVSKHIYRAVAMLLVATMLTTSVTPLSYASDRPNAEPQGELICGFTEHMHTQELCCEEVQTLTCALEETEGHSHTKKCYDTERILVCDLDEGTAADTSGSGLAFVRFAEDNSTDSSISFAGHTHSRSCYDTDKTLVCDLAEQEAHWHVDTCYTTESMLRCILPIHVHTDSCYAKEEEPKFTQQILTTTGSGVSVSGILPEGAALQVRDLTDEEYEALPVELDTLLFAYDITILVDGEAYQPKTPVTVSVTPQMMTYSLRGPMPSITVHHVTGTDDNGDAEVETVARNAMNDEGTVTFMADSFSVYYGVMQTVEESNIIYFDLSAGDVTINGSSYNGYRYDGEDTAQEISGTWAEGQSYYVYQSNGVKNTGLIGETIVLPQYDRVTYNGESWGEYITNHPNGRTDGHGEGANSGSESVKTVIVAWETATEGKRQATEHSIKFTGNVGNIKMVIDNLWSSYQGSGQGRTHGSIGYNTYGTNYENNQITLNLKGDNRLANIFYATKSNKQNDPEFHDTGNRLIFDYYGTESDATLTVANNSTNLGGQWWNAAIGSSDSYDACYGLVFNGGIIYAGTTANDDCTAIGGGGNGAATVVINGGTITAVSSTSGSSIGGGIGKSAQGGSADITIKGGTVFAYNFGYGRDYAGKNYNRILSSAIGGGSSSSASGCKYARVKIDGGNVYAQSVGGTAIGGGSSTNSNGGNAEVAINGGNVEAKSIGGSLYQMTTQNIVTINPGAAIGGGTGNAKGGYAKLTVNEVDSVNYPTTLITGSIGGGGYTAATGTIGAADVIVTGGIIKGQAIMAAGSESHCSFTMTGGTWTNNTDTSYTYLQPNGGAVWMDDPNGVAILSGGTIQGCTAENGGAIYMTAGTFTLSGTGTIDNCTATGNTASAGKGGAVYLGANGEYKGTFTMNGGTLSRNKANDIASDKGIGGAIYLDGGDATINGGSIGIENSGNSAYNGGGAYLAGGTLRISGGSVAYNIATNDGGGAYVAGGNVNVTGGYIQYNTAAQSGGGIYVQDGNYTQVGGNVSNNTAINGKGGGVFASANTANVAAKILSGNVSSNTAGTHGGAIAVVGNNAAQVQVIIGVNEQHFDKDGNKIDCDHDEKEANSLVQDAVLSCPIVSNNRVTATTNSGGGAVYVTEGNGTADETLLYIYCLTAKENAVNNTGTTESLSDFMLVEGGTVQVSTALNPTEQNQTATYGCINITGNMHVVGGKVDLWGNTKNPLVNGIITVDIAEDEEWCRDHREVDNGYTITYYENMGNDVMRYNSYPISKGEIVEIKGNIFNRPGYELQGWHTSSNAQPSISAHSQGTAGSDAWISGWYQATEKHTFDEENHNKNLVLYAIWRANGYTVQFDANVPSGISYENNYSNQDATQTLNYGVEANLISNQYFYPGHIFTGWNTKADGSGESYENEENVLNLATSGTVTLYAQWNVCPHDSSCTFTYTANGATLTKACSCKAYSEGITISAENATYNGSVHDATLSTDTWGLSIQYKKGDEVLSGAPVNAGTYTAGITVEGVTASVTYTINKATQPAPEKPTFTANIATNNSALKVDMLAKNISEVGTVAEYQVVHYQGETKHESGWIQFASGSEQDAKLDFAMDYALTNYYVYVRYAGNDNYHPSAATQADQHYFYKGKVSIITVCAPGIRATLSTGTDNLIITPMLDSVKYYLVNNEFSGTHVVTNNGDSTEDERNEISFIYDEDNDYFIMSNIPDKQMTITVSISGAEKGVSIAAQIVENQVFGTVNGGDTANVSVGSSYTAYFEVTDYDTSVYKDLSVTFSSAPSKVILLDKSDNSYWYCDTPSTPIALSSFTRMGTKNTKYNVFGTHLKLQFIVDGVNANTTTSLTATKSGNAPELNSSVTTNVDSAEAALSTTNDGTLTQTVTHTYTVPDGYTDTQWDYRHGALVLSEKVGTTLPADARLSVAIGNAEAVYYKNGSNQFVIPLGDVATGSANITLVSDFIPDNSASYTLEVKWMASESIADLAPENGDVLDTLEITFTSAAATIPAVKISSESRLVKAGSTYDVTIAYRNISSMTASVALYRAAENGGFAQAGAAQIISLPSTAPSISYKVSIPSDRTGSAYLCLELKDGLNVVKTVEHYFIIEEAPNNDESPNGNHI